MTKVTEKKSFGIALLLWFFLWFVGGHRVYIKEKVSIIFYYWALIMVTFGIILIVDLFKMKRMIEEANEQ